MNFMYDLIVELCKSKGINVSKMCKDCKISRSILTDFKNGRIKKLSLDNTVKIADYFGVSVDYLCGAESTEFGEEALKTLLFGGDTTVTDDMWQEVKDYALFLKQKYNK